MKIEALVNWGQATEVVCNMQADTETAMKTFTFGGRGGNFRNQTSEPIWLMAMIQNFEALEFGCRGIYEADAPMCELVLHSFSMLRTAEQVLLMTTLESCNSGVRISGRRWNIPQLGV